MEMYVWKDACDFWRDMVSNNRQTTNPKEIETVLTINIFSAALIACLTMVSYLLLSNGQPID